MVIFARNRANEPVKGRSQVNDRFAGLMGALTVVIAIALLSPVRLDGQGRSSAAELKAPAKTWNQLRTPDGQPGLQGVWSNATLTPLERPAAFAGREFLTEKEQACEENAIPPRTRHAAAK